jgi:hypothetical protein
MFFSYICFYVLQSIPLQYIHPSRMGTYGIKRISSFSCWWGWSRISSWNIAILLSTMR